MACAGSEKHVGFEDAVVTVDSAVWNYMSRAFEGRRFVGCARGEC